MPGNDNDEGVTPRDRRENVESRCRLFKGTPDECVEQWISK